MGLVNPEIMYISRLKFMSYVCIHRCLYINICLSTCRYVCMYECMPAQSIIRVCTQTHDSIYLYVNMFVCKQTHVYVYMCVHTHMYICMYV